MPIFQIEKILHFFHPLSNPIELFIDTITQLLPQTPPTTMNHITVITYNNLEYIIGAHLSKALNRETYNFYRSLRKRQIPFRPAPYEFVDVLLKKQIIKKGTRSVTLIPKSQKLIDFIQVQLQQSVKTRRKRNHHRPPQPPQSPQPLQPLELIAVSILASSFSCHYPQPTLNPICLKS